MDDLLECSIERHECIKVAILPPGPDKLCDLGYGMYMKVKGEIDRGRPGVDEREPWPRLTAVQQREMDEAVAMPRQGGAYYCHLGHCHCDHCRRRYHSHQHRGHQAL